MDEFELIRKVSEGVPRIGERLVAGIGDDTAVIEGKNGSCWLVTIDILAENIHFKREYIGWQQLGRKALLVNISDIAAMGGKPLFYFISVASPHDISEGSLLEFVQGMKEVAVDYNMILAGGDTTASDGQFFVSITVLGRADRDKIIYRSGAKVGDGIFVSGSLGGSAAGLFCLKKGIKDHRLIKRHLEPEVRLKLSSWLAENDCASAMIDISDGLLADLDHIADESGVGYKLNSERLPAGKGVGEFAKSNDIPLLDLVTAGGEDYELLFTMSSEQEKKLFGELTHNDFGCAVTKVGEVVSESHTRNVLDSEGNVIDIKKRGYVHKLS